MILAQYKGNGTIFDKLIRWWTKSPYSHCELIIDGIWYSSSPRDGKVRSKRINPKEGNWDFVHFDASSSQKERAKSVFMENMGDKYDWLGIFFSQIFHMGIESREKWFCSEICADALHYAGVVKLDKKPSAFSPGDLFDIAVFCGIPKKG